MLTQLPNKFSFSSKKLEKLTPPLAGQAIFWDAKTPGLGIRVTKNGAKAYITQNRLNGKTIRLTIGFVDSWSIEEAQAEARRLAVLIDRGIDPRLEKIRITFSQKQTALAVWDEYIKQKEKRWSHRYFLDHKDMSRDGGEIISRGLRKDQSNIKERGFLRPLLNLSFNQLTREKVR